ncbi:MAG TPA: DUF2800 domain-containing protein [Polyangiaceae bacterium]|nr:DUF2800 domain-containing protein [Polyangiaceae bacterium]
MADITHLRASSLPLAFLCPASARPPKLRIVQSNDAADVGTAVHEALRPLVETGRLDWDAIPGVAARYGADLEETRFLCARANSLWSRVQGSFPDAVTEVPFSERIGDVELTGTVDIVSLGEEVARAADWKTGHKDSDYKQQALAYCALLLLSDYRLQEASCTLLWVRDQDVETYRLDRAGLGKWKREFLARVVEWNGAFYPGHHCGYCPHSHECEAANALIRRDVAAIADKELVARAECAIELMSPEEIVSVLQKADTVARYAERVRQAIKKHVERHGDIIANGLRLTIDTETRRSIDVLKAWPVLDKHFSDEDLAECITVSISKAEKVVATRAGRGKGAAAVRALNGELDAAGAVEPKEVKRLVVKRA